MKVRTEDAKDLSDFKLLSFDCFGTLVDWESGIYHELQLLRGRLPASHPLKSDRALLIQRFNEIEIGLCASQPGLQYSSLLAETYLRLVEELSLPAPPQSEVDALGASVGRWPAFPDTVEALHRLQKHYKLVILSNIDHKSFQATLGGALAGVTFDAIYIAEDIGSYKPDLENFHYLFEHVKKELGVEKEKILHTAHGLRSDHVPAKELGLSSTWIARGDRDGDGGEGTTLEAVQGKVAFTWQFDSLGEMAENVEGDFGGKK